MKTNKKYIYFDHNSSSILDPEIKSALLPLLDLPLNPSSSHKYGQYANKIKEESRDRIMSSILSSHKDLYKLIFTSSATEANNLIIKGIDTDLNIASVAEHKSIIEPLKYYNKNYLVISINDSGLINIDSLKTNIEANKRCKKILLSITLCNNETGIIQPLKEVFDICHFYNIVTHLDITQAIGKYNFSFSADYLPDILTFSSHKIGGPHGAGAVVFKNNLDIKPLIVGGGQENFYRSGTENIAAIYGFSLAIEKKHNNSENISNILALRKDLEQTIMSFCQKSVPLVYIDKNIRSSNTTILYMPNCLNTEQTMFFDINNIAVGVGSSCSYNFQEKNSHTLKGMGFSDETANNIIRISLGNSNTKDDITVFCDLWHKLYCKYNEKNIT